jgi:hypothetical protein
MYLYNYPMIKNHKLTHGNKSYINSKDKAEAEWRIWSRSRIFEGIRGKNESEASLKELEAEYLNEDESTKPYPTNSSMASILLPDKRATRMVWIELESCTNQILNKLIITKLGKMN